MPFNNDLVNGGRGAGLVIGAAMIVMSLALNANRTVSMPCGEKGQGQAREGRRRPRSGLATGFGPPLGRGDTRL